jgi:hypothetical protein
MATLKGPCWDELAELALNHVRHAGAEYGDIRIQHIETQTISGEDRRIANIQDTQDIGFGVRVLHDGAWGFAASSILSIEEIPRVAELAIQVAKGSASINHSRIQLTAEPMYQGTVKTPWKWNPFDVPLEGKMTLLLPQFCASAFDFELKNHLGTSVGLTESDISLPYQEVTQMVTRKPSGKRDREQGRNGDGKADAPRRTMITPDTPYGECSERLTAFGGLLALVKFLDLLGFEQAFQEHYVHPKRECKLGGYRMVLGMLLLLFIGFQRLGHFTYVRTDAMVCGVLRVGMVPAVSTFWRYLTSLGIVPSASLLRLGAALRARVWALCAYAPRRVTVNIDTTVATVYGAIEGARKGHNTQHRGKKGLRPVLCVLDETREYLCGRFMCAATGSSSAGRASAPVWTRDCGSPSVTSGVSPRFLRRSGIGMGSTTTTSAGISQWDGSGPAASSPCGFAKTSWGIGLVKISV